VSGQFILTSCCVALLLDHAPVFVVATSVWLTTSLYWGVFPDSPWMRRIDMATVAVGAVVLTTLALDPAQFACAYADGWACMRGLVPFAMLANVWLYTKSTGTANLAHATQWHACIHIFATCINCLIVLGVPIDNSL